MARTRTSRTGRAPPTAGFTLFELIVVLAIVGLIAAVAVPTLTGGRAGAELRSAAGAVAAGLRQARTDAIFKSREVPFVVDVGRRIFAVEGRTAQSIPESVEITFRTAESELRSEESGAIRFYPDGSSTGGWVALAAAGGGRTPTRVDVEWLTGRVVVTGE